MEQKLHKDSILRLVRHPLYYIGTFLCALWSFCLAMKSRWHLRYMENAIEFQAKLAQMMSFLSKVFPLLLCIALIFLAICGLKRSVSQRACTIGQISLVSLILSCFLGQVSSMLSMYTVNQFLNSLPVLISGFVGNFAIPTASAIFAICYLRKAKRSTAVFLSVFLFATMLFKLTDLFVCAKYLAQVFQTTFWGYVFAFPFESFMPMIIYLCFAVLFLQAAKQKTEP